MKEEWKLKGCIDQPAPECVDLAAEIRRMCKEKDAVVMAHYYTDGAVQDVADFIGDSLALARKAAETEAKVIVMCGVHFMAETCSLLCPDKTVLCPDLNAGCSLADSCRAEDLAEFKRGHDGYTVVSYVNTTAAVKALTDVVVTSGNAERIIRRLPEDAKIIFGPDRHLGDYVNAVTGRNMLLWQGGCHVHGRFSAGAVRRLKAARPDAVVMAHLECSADVLALADVKGSTEMRKRCPSTEFIPVPPEGGGACNVCEYMKLNTLLKVYNTLKYGWPVVSVPDDIARQAVKPIKRMLELS